MFAHNDNLSNRDKRNAFIVLVVIIVIIGIMFLVI
jgi:hypothetical protein